MSEASDDLEGLDARGLARRIGALIDERRFAEAFPLAARWAALAPDDWRPHADLTVTGKHAGDWAAVLRAADRVVALGHGDAGVHWNAGVAATALGDWPRARRAWLAAGVRLPAGEEHAPIAWALGPTPIRVGPRDAQEVVWCERICPARAIIRSVPLHESGRRFGDLVLHDGEPRGKRRLGAREVSVFDELCVLAPSRVRAHVVQVHAPHASDVAALREVLREASLTTEDWTDSVQRICKACSEGSPHEHHDTAGGEAWSTERHIAVATEADDIGDEVLAAWERAGEGREVVEITLDDRPLPPA
jgi:hypothetical protein